jgi:hypothetical protein
MKNYFSVSFNHNLMKICIPPPLEGFELSYSFHGWLQPGLPDFSWRNMPKLGKNIPKRLENIQNYHRMSIPNAHKIYQKAIMYNQNFWDFG